MKKNKSHIILKLLAFILLLIIMNRVYHKTTYSDEVTKYADLLDSLNSKTDEAEILFFGESSNYAIAEGDIRDLKISEFIAGYYPGKKLKTINKGAQHAETYYWLLRNIPEPAPLETVIITLNLRSFNAQWIYSELESNIQRSLVMMKPYPPLLQRFLLAFKGYDHKNAKEREKQFKGMWKQDELQFPYKFPYKNVIEWDKAIFSGKAKSSNPDLAAHYIKAYAFQIDTHSNPRIRDFDRIVELCHEKGWNLVFNLLAENMELADSLVGEDLTYLMEQNRDLLVNRYHKNGVLLVDNLEAVPDPMFRDRDWTTEHYIDKGRKIVGRNVAKKLKSIYPQEFIDIDNQTRFFNDMEGDVNWQNMGQRTTDHAYSGSYSTTADKSNPFTVTYSIYLDQIPENARKKVEVSFWVFSKGATTQAQTAIEFNGAHFKWLGKKFGSQIIPGKWCRVSHQFMIEDYFEGNHMIKIYIMNESKTPVFVDNMEINFLD